MNTRSAHLLLDNYFELVRSDLKLPCIIRRLLAFNADQFLMSVEVDFEDLESYVSLTWKTQSLQLEINNAINPARSSGLSNP